jgi:hypothetical protein
MAPALGALGAGAAPGPSGEASLKRPTTFEGKPITSDLLTLFSFAQLAEFVTDQIGFPAARALLGRRLQLPPKPLVCSQAFYWINQIDHNLMDPVARGALKRPDIEAGGAWCNPGQRRCRLAGWT